MSEDLTQSAFLFDMDRGEFMHAQKSLLVFGGMLAELPLEALIERLEAHDASPTHVLSLIPPHRYVRGPETDDPLKQLARLRLLAWAAKQFKQRVLPAGPEQQDAPPEGYKLAEQETPHYHQQAIVLVHGEDCLACAYERQLRLLDELRGFLSGVAVQLEQTEARRSEAANVRGWVARIDRSINERR